MPTSYTIDDELVRLELSGEYSMGDLQETLDQAMNDPQFPSDALMLWDMTRSKAMDKRSPEDLRYMARYLTKIADRWGSRMAIATGSRLHYGMMRMAEVYSEFGGLKTRAFLTSDEALEWLVSRAPD